MRMSFLDRTRAAQLMAAAELDALVVCAPHAFTYCTGGDPGVAALFGRAGAAFALVPADPALPVGAVVGDLALGPFRTTSPVEDVRTHPLWIETGRLGSGATVAEALETGWESRPSGFSRPATFDLALAAAALRDFLTSRHLSGARLGFDLAFVPSRDRDVLAALLAPARVLDGSDVLDRLMAVKHAEEVRRLRMGVELSVAGLHAMAEAARADDDARELSAAFRAGVAREAHMRGEAVPPSWQYIAIGPEPWEMGGRIAPGSVIKADVGCVVGGYSSDTSRNYVWGEPSRDASELHRMVEDAHAEALGALHPGARLADVHAAATRSLREAGLRSFTRGHFGHGLGTGPFSEAWPFIAADSDAVAEPGMVLAVEVPLYVSGLGGFNLEDQVLVTSDSVEVMSEMSKSLMVLPN